MHIFIELCLDIYCLPSAWQKSAAGLPVSTLTSDSLVLVKVGGVTTFSTTSCNMRMEMHNPVLESLHLPYKKYTTSHPIYQPLPVSSCLQVSRRAAVVLLLRVRGPILGFISRPTPGLVLE